MNVPASLPQEIVTLSKTERREYAVGVLTAVALAAVLVFTALANRPSAPSAEGVFMLTAAFHRADGIHVGSQVRVAGVNIGSVSAAALDDQQRAVLTLRLAASIVLPNDTAAVIETDGLFGTKYIELRPGGTDDVLKSGGRILYSQDSVIIEDLVALIVRQGKDAKVADRAVKADSVPEKPADENQP